MQAQVASFMEQMGIMFNCPSMSDVDIQVENETIKAHEVILAAQSPVFKKYFEGRGRRKRSDSGSTVIAISDYKAKNIRTFLKFLYTFKVERQDINNELLMIAYHYENEHLKKLVREELIKTITAANVTSLLDLSANCKCTELKEHASSFIVNNLEFVKKTGSFNLVRNAMMSIYNTYAYTVKKNETKQSSQTFVLNNISKLNKLLLCPFVVDNVPMELLVQKQNCNGVDFLSLYIRNLCNDNIRLRCELTMDMEFKLIKETDNSVLHKVQQKGFCTTNDKVDVINKFIKWERLLNPELGFLNLENDSITLQVVMSNVEMRDTDAPEDLKYTVLCS